MNVYTIKRINSIRTERKQIQMAEKEKDKEEKLKEDKEEKEQEESAETEAEENAEAESGESKSEEAENAEAGADAEAEESGAGDGAAAEGKKSKMQEKLDELNDKVMRQMAEFDNFRRRSEKEKQAMFETGAKSVIEKLLPVVDNFERGLATVAEEDKDSAFAKGMQMVYKQLMEELEKLEVKPIEAVGQEFDPNFHNAVMHIEDEEAGENMVVEELQKGYTYRENVVRHSMVKVAN